MAITNLMIPHCTSALKQLKKIQFLSEQRTAVKLVSPANTPHGTDIDGQERDKTYKEFESRPTEWRIDVGADEYSDVPITRHPLTAAEVGPDAP